MTNDYRWQRVDDLVSSSLHSAHHNDSEQLNKESSSLAMGDNALVNGVNLLSIQDELVLHEMLDRSEDYEDRKKIRARLKDVLADMRAKREEMIRHRENEREEMLRNRVRDAEEQKRRTLAMYDAMAKSAPAGGNKVMDVNYLREDSFGTKHVHESHDKVRGQWPNACSTTLSFTYSQLLNIRNDLTNNSKESTPGSPTTIGSHKVDQVEEAIRLRQREANERKARTLAAYDTAAKSGPAGSARFIDFDAVRPEDLAMNSKQKPSSCFQMKGGVPITAPVRPLIAPPKEEEYDPMEAAIRKRQQECDDRKRRTLDAYDKAARSRPAGAPISVYIPYCEGIEPVIEVAGRLYQPKVDDSQTTPSTPPRSRHQFFEHPTQMQPRYRAPGVAEDLDVNHFYRPNKYVADHAQIPQQQQSQPPPPPPPQTQQQQAFNRQNQQQQAFNRPNQQYQSQQYRQPPFGQQQQQQIQQQQNQQNQLQQSHYNQQDDSKQQFRSSHYYQPNQAANQSRNRWIFYYVDFSLCKLITNKAKAESPREKFQRMDSSSGGSTNGTKSSTGITFSKPAATTNINRSPTAIKEMLLNWVKSKTKEYENVKIENFSTTWNDGMAFCALIHHFYPDAFDFKSLDPKNRRYNFDLAFRVAEEKGDVAPLLEVDDMVIMKKPDWKCVFTYVQSLYRRFHNVD
ncbi:hypothetical protein CHUAL_005862 [Chamberlinius hualienensis]